MSETWKIDNRVKALRQARGWTQDQLAQAAGLSRTGIGAIEAARLVPSVAAALSLARALDCTVEDLFGPHRQTTRPEFAWMPAAFPCRYWAAEVSGRRLLFPAESSPQPDALHDGMARHARDLPAALESAGTTLVLASCDPAAGLLATIYRQQTGFRMLVLTRSSGEALALVERGLIHVAGVHLASVGDRGGNSAAVARRERECELQLLHVAKWEEGLACRPASRVRSPSAAVRGKLRWVGRSRGAGARRCQDELLGFRRSPRNIAGDHRGVVEAIKNGWADVGVCLRLASEEGQLAFIPVVQEEYDLCFRREQAADPRIAALCRVIRSAEYRRLLTELPGYRPQAHMGEIEDVPFRG